MTPYFIGLLLIGIVLLVCVVGVIVALIQTFKTDIRLGLGVILCFVMIGVGAWLIIVYPPGTKIPTKPLCTHKCLYCDYGIEDDGEFELQPNS